MQNAGFINPRRIHEGCGSCSVCECVSVATLAATSLF